MISRWIVYLLSLAGAAVFCGVYTESISYIILICLLLLPPLSLALGLCGMLSCRAHLTAPVSLPLGGRGSFVISLTASRFLPPARARVRYELQDETYRGKRLREHDNLGCFGVQTEIAVPLDCRHCGAVSMRVLSMRVYDFMGFFFIYKRPDEVKRVLILPLPEESDSGRELAPEQAAPRALRPKRGGGFAEDYDIRQYVPGDAPSSVHWKLSAKTESLVVREPLVADGAELALAFSLYGAPQDIDSVLGQVLFCAQRLLDTQMPFLIVWRAGELVRSIYVSSEAELGMFWPLVFSDPIPLTGREISAFDAPEGTLCRIIRPKEAGK